MEMLLRLQAGQLFSDRNMQAIVAKTNQVGLAFAGYVSNGPNGVLHCPTMRPVKVLEPAGGREKSAARRERDPHAILPKAEQVILAIAIDIAGGTDIILHGPQMCLIKGLDPAGGRRKTAAVGE